jgi:hypothetical protein
MWISSRIQNTIVILFVSFIIVSCTDISSVIPQSSTYKVALYIDNTPLETNGLINTQKTIKPVFVNSVANDPDVQGLSITIKNLQNEEVSSEILYAKSPIETSGTRILIPNLDKNLPEFQLPTDLMIGPYLIVVKVLGNSTVLSEKEIPIYYLGDATLSITNLYSYPPGHKPSPTAPLYPPHINLLLQGSIVFDARLDPYLIWYEGANILKEGRLTEISSNLLWETAHNEGFHTIRLEVYPENPHISKVNAKVPSISKNLRIAITKTAPIPGIDFTINNYSWWYHFLGTLSAQTSNGSEDYALVKKGLSDPLWLAGTDSYGLAIGEAHQYLLKKPILPEENAQIHEGTMLLRFAPYIKNAKGTLFYALFENSNNPKTPFALRLCIDSDKLVLKAQIDEHSAATATLQTMLEPPNFYTVELFVQQKGSSITISTAPHTNPVLTLQLPSEFVYANEGSFGFGEQKSETSDSSSYPGPIPEQILNDTTLTPVTETATHTAFPIIAIIDEFGVRL